MLANGENLMAYNDFSEVPYIPYKILEELLVDKSKEVEDFWKLLKYPTTNCLKKNNLTDEEKDKLIWRGEDSEDGFKIFLKPLLTASLTSAENQILMRLYRYNTMPIDQYNAMICFQVDFITNDKTCLVYDKGMLCERADKLVNQFLQIFNGRDIGVGILSYDRNKSRSCQDLMSINNSKSLYGRSLVLALDYHNAKVGEGCG